LFITGVLTSPEQHLRHFEPNFPEALGQSLGGSLRGGTSGRADRKDQENGQKRKLPDKRPGMPERFLKHLNNPGCNPYLLTPAFAAMDYQQASAIDSSFGVMSAL
jgi:hypothetical protein